MKIICTHIHKRFLTDRYIYRAIARPEKRGMLQYWLHWQQCVCVTRVFSCLANYLCMHVCMLCDVMWRDVMCVSWMWMWRTWLMYRIAPKIRLRRLFLCRQFWQPRVLQQHTTSTTTMKMLLIFLRFQSSQVDLHHCSSFHGCATSRLVALLFIAFMCDPHFTPK